MKLLTTALLAATAFAVVAPAASAQSQAYGNCQSDRQGRQVAGAIIGGILGAVIGNEIADDSNNRPNYRRGGRGHHDNYRGRNYRNDRGNAEEVGTIAGAGVGALIGAGIAGGDGCDNRRATRTYGDYEAYPGKPGYADNSYQDQGYRGYPTQAYRDDGSDYGYIDGSNSRSSTQLLGGAQADPYARTYNAGAQQDSNCQWTSTRRMDEYGQPIVDQVYMCQGNDNIWRPYDTYTQ
ncbi:hypothetical protein [uncultured Maricaulis sp.]|uniref:hypothetical protein n=1 Tax=uncultured Maricaulis sp. TaxID=174710 RepID=UPI0030D99AA0